MAVRVLIKPSSSVPNFNPKFEEILRNSFSEWEDNSKSKIKFKYVTEPPVDITCQFVEEFPKEKHSVAGLTSYQTSPHHMDSAVISIKTNCSIRPLTDNLMRAICLHEIGHALGLVEHSLDPHDIMYPYLGQQKSLSARDINTMHLLYEFRPPDAILKLERREVDPNYPFGLIALSSEDYDAYTRKLVARLIQNFKPFSARPMLECSVRFLVDSTGNIGNYRIFQTSTNDEFDQKVLSALLSAVPLPPPSDKLRKNKWSKTPVAMKFRSDGWVVPYIEPDSRQSDEWLQSIEEPSPDEMMRDLAKYKTATPKVTDPNLEPWIVTVSQKAHAAWKVKGTGKAEVVVGIRNNGSIAHLVIAQSSGDEAFDNAALNACMSAEPYPAAPNSSQDTTEVNLLFER